MLKQPIGPADARVSTPSAAPRPGDPAASRRETRPATRTATHRCGMHEPGQSSLIVCRPAVMGSVHCVSHRAVAVCQLPGHAGKTAMYFWPSRYTSTGREVCRRVQGRDRVVGRHREIEVVLGLVGLPPAFQMHAYVSA